MAPHKKPGITRARATKYIKTKRSTEQTIDVGEGLNEAPEGEIRPAEPPKKKGRGPGRIKAVKDAPDERPEVWRVGYHEFSCKTEPKLITATITRIALGLMPAPVRSFHSFTDDAKKNLQSEFLERYRYAKDEDPARCREVLEAIACKRYCEELGTARKKCIKKYGWDIDTWKANHPHWCLAPQHWRVLCDMWFSEEWQLVSKQNQQNRSGSGNPASHYAGSASAHRHFEKLTTLNKGKKPTMEELYIHIHCARENGISPVVAQIAAAAAAEESVTEITENVDGIEGVNPTASEKSGQVYEYDINSLKFTDENKEKIYKKVRAMRADQANVEFDDSTLFMTAIGGPKRGRIAGFGSLLEQRVQIATTRERHNHATSSISGLTNSGDCGVQETFSRAEVDALMQARDRRIEEERAERKRDQAQNQLMFSQLFKMYGLQAPPSQAPASCPELPQDGIVGNMGHLEVPSPTTQPSQELPMGLQMEFNQEAGGSLQPNQNGSFQALLSSQIGQEIAGNDAAMTNWWANQPST